MTWLSYFVIALFSVQTLNRIPVVKVSIEKNPTTPGYCDKNFRISHTGRKAMIITSQTIIRMTTRFPFSPFSKFIFLPKTVCIADDDQWLSLNLES